MQNKQVIDRTMIHEVIEKERQAGWDRNQMVSKTIYQKIQDIE